MNDKVQLRWDLPERDSKRGKKSSFKISIRESKKQDPFSDKRGKVNNREERRQLQYAPTVMEEKKMKVESESNHFK